MKNLKNDYKIDKRKLRIEISIFKMNKKTLKKKMFEFKNRNRREKIEFDENFDDDDEKKFNDEIRMSRLKNNNKHEKIRNRINRFRFFFFKKNSLKNNYFAFLIDNFRFEFQQRFREKYSKLNIFYDSFEK